MYVVSVMFVLTLLVLAARKNSGLYPRFMSNANEIISMSYIFIPVSSRTSLLAAFSIICFKFQFSLASA